jgi:hypothetical protein
MEKNLRRCPTGLRRVEGCPPYPLVSNVATVELSPDHLQSGNTGRRCPWDDASGAGNCPPLSVFFALIGRCMRARPRSGTPCVCEGPPSPNRCNPLFLDAFHAKFLATFV